MEKRTLPVSASERMNYAELCAALEAIKHGASISAKRQRFAAFLHEWRRVAEGTEFSATAGHHQHSFYPALRLFAPSLDERAFGIREPRLNALVCKELMIAPLEYASAIVSSGVSGALSFWVARKHRRL